jgi:hypothetical protein
VQHFSPKEETYRKSCMTRRSGAKAKLDFGRMSFIICTYST